METMEMELYEAAREGDLQAVRRLVETVGVNPDCAVGEGKTPLQISCLGGQIDVVRYLIEECGVDAKMVGNTYGLNALHIACSYTTTVHLATVKYLVEQVGLSVEERANNGNTALHYICFGSASADRLEIIRYLVENHGADVDARNLRGGTPLGVASSCRPDNLTLYLLQKAKSLDEGDLAMLVHRCSWNVIEEALRKYAACQSNIDENAYELNPIHSILEHFPLPYTEQYESCIMRLSSTRTPRLLDEQGRFPVHVALTSSNTRAKTASIISMLVDMEPKSALARDPTTGLYPYESVFLLDRTGVGGGDCCEWLDLTYKLFRGDPTRFLQTRNLVTLTVLVEEPQQEKETAKR